VANIGQPLRIHIFSSQQQIGAAPEVHVLLHGYFDLLLVERLGVFDEAGMNTDMIR
jgi:hypothetical protein